MTQDVDVDKVEKELISALEADRKYFRENDAKFRAVHQKVGTYEEFREIVKASHLTPLDHDDITGRKGRKQPWNPIATSSTDAANAGGVVTDSSCPNFTPTNIQEFIREWRRMKLSPQDRYKFLMQFGRDQLQDIFKIEVSMELLGEMLEVLNASFTVDETNKVLDFLEVLSGSSRFSLSLSFLNKKERTAVLDLFLKIKADMEDLELTSMTCRTSFVDLCKVYEVTI